MDPRDQVVYLIKETTANRRSVPDDEQFRVLHDGSTPTGKFPAATVMPGPRPLPYNKTTHVAKSQYW